MTVKRETVPLAAPTLRGLHRKTQMTLDEILALGPRAFRFVITGPHGKQNSDAIIAARAARRAKQ